jgi:hypothetical protein
MNHQKIYDNIIFKAKLKNRKKIKKTDINYVYYEKHHIISKCLGGGEENENKVLLTAKEHYVCHKLLTYIYSKNRKIACAFNLMTFDKRGKHNISSRDYAYARELKVKFPIIVWNKGKCGLQKHSEETKQKMSNERKGKPKSEEHKKKMRLLKMGNTYMKGKKCSDETKEKMSKAKKGKTFTEEHKKHISESHKGKVAWNKGCPMLEETKLKISNKLQGKKKPPRTYLKNNRKSKS